MQKLKAFAAFHLNALPKKLKYAKASSSRV
jgi:hypothetical protein